MIAIALVISYFSLKYVNINQIDLFIRDSLQYLNSPKKIDSNLVTVSLNIYSDNIEYPHNFNNIKKIILKLKQYNPKTIILMMEPLDFNIDDKEKQAMYDFLVKEKNVYLNMYISRSSSNTFSKDSIFQKYPKQINLNKPIDDPRDLQSRRAMLSLEPNTQVELIKNLEDMGLKPKDISFYKYAYPWWSTTLAYLKSFPLGSFGNLQSADLFADRINADRIKDKIVIVGTNDQYSFMAPRSIFSLFNNSRDQDQVKYQIPLQDVFANIINFHTTGDYIKYLYQFDDLFYLVSLLVLIVFVNVSLNKKLYTFLSLLPIILFTQIVMYLIGDFYINFSRSILLLIISQYFVIPFILLSMFKKQEKQKLQEVNDARIDALLSVSEKVAHDIRSPLGAINLILSRTKFDNPEHREIVTNAIQRIDSSAENILKKYKLQHNEQLDSFEKIDINSMLKKMVDEKLILDQSINYTLDLKPNKDSYVLGYAIELERVISNILDNSIFALRNKQKNRQIKISTDTLNSEFVLEFFDNGAGIPANILKLLGNQQITTKGKSQGHGIGILHAKRTLERMNGTLLIESNENEYSRVTIKLKLAQ